LKKKTPLGGQPDSIQQGDKQAMMGLGNVSQVPDINVKGRNSIAPVRAPGMAMSTTNSIAPLKGQLSKKMTDIGSTKMSIRVMLKKINGGIAARFCAWLKAASHTRVKKLKGNTLSCFKPGNCFRIFCYRVVRAAAFRYFISICSCFNIVTMCLYNPINGPENVLNIMVDYATHLTGAVYLTQMVFEIISFGLLANGKSSYLKKKARRLH
jgi:hypothetical protein